tara:strand:- start:20 stop:481 length:462 start_codon:yes stop_codon:yes gene_type:complete
MKHDFPKISPTISELLSELKEKGVRYEIETLNRGIKHRIRTLNEDGLIDKNSVSYDFGYEKGEPAVSINKQGVQTADYYEGVLKEISVFSSGVLERKFYFDDSGEISREETVEEIGKRLKDERGGKPTVKDLIEEKMKKNAGKVSNDGKGRKI